MFDTPFDRNAAEAAEERRDQQASELLDDGSAEETTVSEKGTALQRPRRLWLALAALFALGMAIAAVASGRGDRLAGEGLVPVAALLLFGLYFAWAYAPWRRGLRVPVKLFAKIFSVLNGDKAPDNS